MLESTKSVWQQSSTVKRISFIVGIITLIIILVISAVWAFRSDYQVLFSELNAQDASAMISELERLKVPYQLADNGTTILVEPEAVYKTRLKLMGKGLNLQGSVGFEIFNNAEFGMTEFAQKVNFQRALQGELSRTIMAFEEIKSARVHLVLPESGLFKHQNAKPKASVSIAMKDDSVLSQEQISGIQRLVAASVPEISPGEVTVVDQRGVAVTRQADNQDGAVNLPERLEVKKQLEDYMTRKIAKVVDRVVGPGKGIVSVDISLNYDQVKVTKEDIVPLPNTSGQDIGAVTRRRETVQGDDNLNEIAAISGADSKSGANYASSASSVEVDYATSRHVEQILSSQGGIAHLSVGVLLPDISDQIKIAKLKELISMTAGINTERGDGLAVYGVDLAQTQFSESNERSVIPQSKSDLTINDSTKVSSQSKQIPKELIFYPLSLVIIFGVLLLLFMNNRNKEKFRMSPDERNRLLEEVLQWSNGARGV